MVTDLYAYRKIDTPLKSAIFQFLYRVSGAWAGQRRRGAVSGDGQLVVMQLDLDICGFDPRKFEAGCDGLRV